jgi:hypothetical protein
MSANESSDVDTNHHVDEESDDGTVMHLTATSMHAVDCLWARPNYTVVTLLDSDFDGNAIARENLSCVME